MNGAQAQLAQRSGGRRTVWWLALAGVLLAVALFLLWRFNPAQLAWPICAFHATTGLHCPGCGGIRATHELLHGRLPSALEHNALLVLSLPLFFYAALSEALRAVRGRPLPGDPARKSWFYLAIAVFAVIFGVLRNVPSHPFTLLVPPG